MKIKFFRTLAIAFTAMFAALGPMNDVVMGMDWDAYERATASLRRRQQRILNTPDWEVDWAGRALTGFESSDELDPEHREAIAAGYSTRGEWLEFQRSKKKAKVTAPKKTEQRGRSAPKGVRRITEKKHFREEPPAEHRARRRPQVFEGGPKIEKPCQAAFHQDEIRMPQHRGARGRKTATEVQKRSFDGEVETRPCDSYDSESDGPKSQLTEASSGGEEAWLPFD